MIKNLKQLSKNDNALAGGKGSSLGEMTQAGMNIPPGFVVLSTAFDKFLKEAGLHAKINNALNKLDYKKTDAIESVSKNIQSLILDAEIPENILKETSKAFKKLNSDYVAIRSSATAEDSASLSWAGQLESYLNATEKTLFENIKKCWASLFTPRAIFYRFENKLGKKKISVAVIVQKMINSDVSGIAFSVHPVSQDRNQIIIEGSFGLGEAIVSGKITPDRYVIEKESRKIIDKNVHEHKQVLTDKKIAKLADMIIQIENHYNFPVDIEWAKEKGKFYILQSRPITTLSQPAVYQPFSNPKYIDKVVRQIIVFLEEETLEVTLLGQGGKCGPFSDLTEFERWVKYVSTESQNPCEVYLYWDTKAEDAFLEIYMQELLRDPDYFDKLDAYFLKTYENFMKMSDRFFRKGAEYYCKQSNKQLIKLFFEFSRVNKPAMAAYYVPYDCVKIITPLIKQEIERVLTELSVKEQNKVFEDLSMIGIDTVVRTERLEFLKTLQQIQKRYSEAENWHDEKIQSFVFSHWYDFGSCVYTHDTNEVYGIDDYQKKFFENINLNAKTELNNLEREECKEANIVKEALSKFKNGSDAAMYVGWMRKMLGYRNREVEYYDNYFDHCLDFFDELAHRLGIALNDLWLLSKQEINDGLLDKADAKRIVRQRKKRGFTIKQAGNNIEVCTGVNREDLHEKRASEVTDLKGSVAYGGRVVSTVKVIFRPRHEKDKFAKDDILVTPMTTPDFVPLMKKAKAVITDEGGILCHAAIVSRELKTPCIIGTKIASQVLKDGDLVEVDANNGIVKILKK